jgi:hypothetical protein
VTEAEMREAKTAQGWTYGTPPRHVVELFDAPGVGYVVESKYRTYPNWHAGAEMQPTLGDFVRFREWQRDRFARMNGSSYWLYRWRE